MYTYTPTTRFLVLSAADSVPFNPNNKFLVLSPTENGPDPRVWDEQAVVDVDQSSHLAVPEHHRSASSSSSMSSDSQFDGVPATLPNGFLYLGHTKSRRASQ
ncbi:hypothetical protein N7492_007234 [Penicillium capsulatum]|uniref:Uncharacterized protein n=1 Tax=Penicillium capsulatum TaxID=69766 RepID=A0A9W9HZG4_9EURO|nr:hypothetical protein N7492_007234 [Penicillium capsulatum]KAJ6117072.1 hypothetical protein N7512_006797 [Penicillium capsulatum]